MPEDISPRQTALKQIWSTSGPDELLVLIARDPAARDPDLVLELRNEADACANLSPDLAERLGRMADFIEQVHASVNRFAAVEGMADLLALYKDFSFCWTGKFSRILGAFWADALHRQVVPKKDALRRALRFLRDVYVAIHLLMGIPKLSSEVLVKTFRESPILCDPDFHAFLDERARFAASHDDPTAQPFREMASYVREACKTLRTITQLENAKSGKGTVQVRLPVPPEVAEAWFCLDGEFSAAMEKVAADVNGGTQTLEAGIEEALRIGRKAGAKAGSSDLLVTTAFLEHLLIIATSGMVQQAVDSYRNSLDICQWDSTEGRAISILRYSKALIKHWQPLNDPHARLSDAVALIDEVLPSVDVNKCPRLGRDLFFARARLLENIGIWQPSAYESAAGDYSRGLAVRAVAHELDARGKALTDYANTLTRIPVPDAGQHDRKIMELYDEALACLDSEKHPLSRGLTLNAYAVYLNERTEGEHARNQERALAMAQEAVDLIERASGMDLIESRDYVLRALASAYLTKCNVIRGREYADYVSSHQVAREALRIARDRLRGVHDDQLCGIILLNLGYVNMDLYEATGNAAHVLEASYAYDEAEKLLQQYPCDFAKALLGKAMLVSEVPEKSGPTDLEESLTAVRKAIAILEASNDTEALARGWFGLGELLLLRARPGDYDDPIDAFNRARVLFLQSGAKTLAIAATRRVAAIKVRQFREGDSKERVLEAKKLLISATRWIDEVWELFETVEWRLTVSDSFADVYAEIAWCQAILGDSIHELAYTVARAKGREFTAHLRDVRPTSHIGEGLAGYLDQLRVESRLVEMSRWRAQRRAEPERSIDDRLRPAQRRFDEIAELRRLLLPRPSLDEGVPPLAAVESFVTNNPAALVLDITTSRWGTVVTLFGGADTGVFAGANVRVLPVDSVTVHGWLSDWLSLYIDYLSASGTDRDATRKDWADQTEALLVELGRQVMQPILRETRGHMGAVELVIASGRLAGLPLHVATLGDGRCVAEAVTSVVYVPNIAILSSEDDTLKQQASTMCVVCDPKQDLPSAAAEAASVAAEYEKRGAKVELLAQVGSAVGREALYKRGVTGADQVIVLNVPPTPRQVSSRLPDCDHFFYTGHGMSANGQSGLLLVDDEGNEELFTEEDVLAIPALRRRPLIVLSACETATGGRTASAELFDFATGLLRIGARFVVGSLWMVVEDCAKTFTAEFYAALARTNKPSLAYGVALRALKKYREAAASSGTGLVPLDHPIFWAPFIALRGG